MKHCAIYVLVLIAPLVARAEADSEVVDAVLRLTKGISREVIVENYNDCDSGITLPLKVCFAYRRMVEDVGMNRQYKAAISVAKRVGADQLAELVKMYSANVRQ